LTKQSRDEEPEAQRSGHSTRNEASVHWAQADCVPFEEDTGSDAEEFTMPLLLRICSAATDPLEIKHSTINKNGLPTTPTRGATLTLEY